MGSLPKVSQAQARFAFSIYPGTNPHRSHFALDYLSPIDYGRKWYGLPETSRPNLATEPGQLQSQARPRYLDPGRRHVVAHRDHGDGEGPTESLVSGVEDRTGYRNEGGGRIGKGGFALPSLLQKSQDLTLAKSWNSISRSRGWDNRPSHLLDKCRLTNYIIMK